MLEYQGQYASCKIFNDDVEETAVQQVYTFLNHHAFEGCKIRIMSDIHAGSGAVIGFTSSLSSKVIPNVIGVDIGCGVCCYDLGNINIDFQELDTFIRSNIPFGCTIRQKQAPREITDKAFSEIKKTDKTIANLSGDFLESVKDVARKTNQDENYVINSLGSLGGGNHYLEINIDANTGHKYLNIHSGSRNFGLKIALFHQNIAKIKHPFGELSYLIEEDFETYCRHMTVATRYARLNREIIAQLIIKKFFKLNDITDRYESIHNYIDFSDGIIRKGAISAKLGEKVVIPWNMRDGIILGIGKGNEDYNNSAPHGAGRIMGRMAAKRNLDLEEYKQEMEGIWSSCINKDTLDESPMAYKNSEVIKALLEPTVDIIASLKPIYNFKASE